VFSAELRVAAGVAVRVAPEMNASVVLVGAASTALALVVLGLIPALHGSRTSVREAIASDGQGAPLPTWRGRRGLIACQVAVSAGLVSVAALCAHQIVGLVRHDTGLDMDRLALLQINASMQRRDDASVRQAAAQILNAARRLPGVESAALSSGFPIELDTGMGAVARTQSELGSGIATMFVVAAPEVFATWGVTVLQGRTFTEQDTASSERVAVLTKRQADRLFPDGAALGEHIALRWQAYSGEPRPPVETIRIVGIVTDTDTGSVGNRGGGYLYLPLTQHNLRTVTLSVRAAGDPAPLVEPMRRLVAGIDPELPIVDAGTAAALGRNRRIVLEVAAVAAGSLGVLALLLAMAGLYGVLSEVVLRRTREMGIRMALGADSLRVLRMVLLDGTRPVLLGLVIGLGWGALLRLAFRPMFVRMLPAFDPYVIALVPCVFIAVALVAAYLPARRASRTDPNVALRHL
jgi:putative ABC transport system permease protein